MALRYDIGTIDKPSRTSQGYLRVPATISRTGIFEYRNPNGSLRRELRLPEEVFHADALSSFASAPVTDDHPSEMITAENTHKYLKGYLGDYVRTDGAFVHATMTITDPELIRKMEDGKRQLSCGYECDLDETPGEWNGQRYDAVQRSIRGNHVAVVSEGRAGPDVKARMDAAVQSSEKIDHQDPKPDTITAMTTEMQAALADAAAQKARADALAAELETARTRSDSLEGENDSLKAQLATAEKVARQDGPVITELEGQVKALTAQIATLKEDLKVATSPERRRADVAARVKLETAAAAILGDKYHIDGADDAQVMRDVVEKLHGPVPKDRSDEYLRARFDAAVEGYFAGEAALARVRDAVKLPEDSVTNRMDSRSARDRMIATNRNEVR